MVQMVTKSPLEWAQAACDSIMSAYAPGELPPAHRWHYHQGVFLCGMELLAGELPVGETRKKYETYMQGYADDLIDGNGSFLFARDELDAVQAGLLLFGLAERTGARKYRVALEKLRSLLDTLNRTTEGGYWHKDKYPDQMWLDGLYMAGVFSLKYASVYGGADLRENVLLQERLMRGHMRDGRTGLLYHAWDESKKMPWADPVTGCSPEFWGRSIGWYGLAVAQFLELLPGGYPGRLELETAFAEFIDALIRYQDPESGLWYQVVDKGDRPDNWLETSCTSLFVYAIAKAVQGGYAGEAALTSARAGYAGLIARLRYDGQGRLILPDICVGTSAGDYAHYVSRPVSENDLHGVGAFVMACMAMHELAEAGASGTIGTTKAAPQPREPESGGQRRGHL